MKQTALTLTFIIALLTTAPLPLFAQTGSRPDVLVVGGAPAGVAAAIAAARRGLRVELDVSGTTLGGVLTDAMMDQWDLNTGPLGEPIEGGIFTEMVDRLGDAFTPERAEAAFTHMLAGTPNVDVHFQNRAVSAAVSNVQGGRAVMHVEFLSPDGVRFVNAPYVIDATEDGDIAALAGARYLLGREGSGIDQRMQAATLMFSLRNVDLERLRDYQPTLYGPGGAVARKVWGFSKVMRRFTPSDPRLLVGDLNLGLSPDGTVTVNAINVLGVNGLDPRSLEEGMALAKTEALRLLPFLRATIPGFERAEIARFPRTLYVRETRHVLGLAYLTGTDVWDGRIPADTIGLSSYPLDLHPVVAGEKPVFAVDRHTYGIPFGALVPRGFTNLVLASRAISASHVASGSARIVATTIEEGEAGGDACAEALHRHLTFEQLDASPQLVAALRGALAARGVVLASPRRTLALRGI